MLSNLETGDRTSESSTDPDKDAVTSASGETSCQDKTNLHEAARDAGNKHGEAGILDGDFRIEQKEYRKWLRDYEKSASQDFDKVVLALSSGLFAISITSIGKISLGTNAPTLALLVFCWISLIISIIANIKTFRATEKQTRLLYDKVSQHLDPDYKCRETRLPGNWYCRMMGLGKDSCEWGNVIDRLNLISSNALVVGLVFFLLFIVTSLYQGNKS